jgi:hypothetical protein
MPSQNYFRVVEHTLNDQGILVMRAVLSGQHKTQEEAQVALEREVGKNPTWSVDPKSGNWRFTDKEGRTHWLRVESF